MVKFARKGICGEYLLFTHSMDMTPHLNGGETIVITTSFEGNRDRDPNDVICTQKITLSSYANTATFLLSDIMTPEKLRELADGIESAQAQAKEELQRLKSQKSTNEPVVESSQE